MEMKPIIVCGEKLRYMACDDGRIFSLINQRFLKPFKNKCGYMLIDLKHHTVLYASKFID